MAVFRVVLDACVLYPIGLTDLLLTTALRGLYQPYWSPEILDEARRNVIADRPDAPADAVRRRFDAMDRALPGANATAPGRLVMAMTNDPKDRHVLALAVHVGAEVIVTDNLKDFPTSACERHGVEAQSPDTFIDHLVSLDAPAVWASLEEMATRRRTPPATASQVLEHLERHHAPTAMASLRIIVGADRSRRGRNDA